MMVSYLGHDIKTLQFLIVIF